MNSTEQVVLRIHNADAVERFHTILCNFGAVRSIVKWYDQCHIGDDTYITVTNAEDGKVVAEDVWNKAPDTAPAARVVGPVYKFKRTGAKLRGEDQ